jgi:Ca-activated chloride channel family protein
MADARHRSRHRPALGRSAAPTRILVAAVVVLVIAGGGYVFGTKMWHGRSSAASCTRTTQLTVGAGPLLTAPLTQIATQYNAQQHQVQGTCFRVKVETVDSGQTADAIASGWTDHKYGVAPDVWVPESKDWLAVAKTSAAGSSMLGADGPVVASSPVVLAMPRPMAAALGWPGRQLGWNDLRMAENSQTFWPSRGHPEWGTFKIGFADAYHSSAGLAAVLNVVASNLGQPVSTLAQAQFTGDLTTKGAVLTLDRGSALVTDADTDLVSTYAGWGTNAPNQISALVMPEALAYQANVGTSAAIAADDGQQAALPAAAVPLVAAYPTDGLVVDEATYQPLQLPAGSVKAAAAADFLAALTGPGGQAIFATDGFRSPDRTNPKLTEQVGLIPALRTTAPSVPDGGTLEAARSIFEGIHQPSNILAVYDTSGSMDDVVPGSGGKTRLQLAVSAADTGLPLFAPASRVGLWQFSTRQNGSVPYRELVPVGPMGDLVNGVPREQAMLSAVNGLQAGGDTGLYETTLAAFESLSASYQPNEPNEVVILTDGQNDDPSSSLTLDQLIARLRAEYNPAKPVHVITISYSPDADASALQQISAATGARSYSAQDPRTILDVMVNALTAR